MEMVTLNGDLAVYFLRLFGKTGGRANCALLKRFYGVVIALGGDVKEKVKVNSQWENFGINPTGLPYSSLLCLLPINKLGELANWFKNLQLPPL
jgi:hypothetical protein